MKTRVLCGKILNATLCIIAAGATAEAQTPCPTPYELTKEELRYYHIKPDDTSVAREIAISYIFETRSGAKEFVMEARCSGLQAQFDPTADKHGLWYATITRRMKPTELNGLEKKLYKVAIKHGGKFNDVEYSYAYR